MLLARFLFQEASLFCFFLFEKLVGNSNTVFFDSACFSFAKEVFFCPTCPSPAGGSLTHSQALALSKRARDVTALRCSEPLRSKVGGASKPSPCFAGWDRLATACFWLHCAWGQLASFPHHVLRAGTAWGQLASGFIAPGDSLLLSLAMFCGMGPPGDSLLLALLRLGTARFFPSPYFAGWDRLGNF